MSDDNYMKKYSDVEPITFDKDKKKSTIQNRLRSKVVWTSVTAIILMIMGHLGVYEKIGVTKESLQLCIDGIFSILILFGIFNDPTNSEKF